MATGVTEADHTRLRTGLVVLVLGISLILWSWGNWLYRATTAERSAPIVATEGAAQDGVRTEVVSLLPQVLMYSLILALVVLFGGYALVRAARRYREGTDRKRAAPTASLDVWAMHKVPESDRDEDRIE